VPGKDFDASSGEEDRAADGSTIVDHRIEEIENVRSVRVDDVLDAAAAQENTLGPIGERSEKDDRARRVDGRVTQASEAGIRGGIDDRCELPTPYSENRL